MKTISRLMSATIVIIVITILSSCGKDGGGVDTYIPDISQVWANSSNINDTYFFNYQGSPTAATGNFSNGTESLSGVVKATVSGSFNHSKITFVLTYKDNSPSKTYSGTMSGSPTKTMVLNGGLTINKQ